MTYMREKQLKVKEDIFNNFMNSKECVIDFLENLHIPELNIKEFDNLRCEYFHNNLITKCRNKNNVHGFVIINDKTEIYVMNPEVDYIHFWNNRNFFVYNLAKYYKNDIIDRYVVYISSKDYKNSMSKFNISPHLHIWNIYQKDEKLENWINALYY